MGRILIIKISLLLVYLTIIQTFTWIQDIGKLIANVLTLLIVSA